MDVRKDFMNSMRSPEKHNFYENYFVARQPVFTASGKCWGYELLFRSPANTFRADFSCDSFASSQVIVDGLPRMLSDISAGCKARSNLSRDMLRDRISLALTKERCVIEILENVEAVPDILRELASLRARGYILALDDYAGQPHLRQVLDMVDIVKVDFRAVTDAAERMELCAALKLLRGQPRVLAEKVETREEYEVAKKYGCSLFQGYFFQKPELVGDRKVPLHAESRLRLLHALATRELEPKELEQLISRDTALSYRLLKFINSAAWPPHVPIRTVAHAIAYMGTSPLRKWLMATIIADNRSSDLKLELALLGTTRGYFFKWLASEVHGPDEDDAFMLGLFSTLEALYDVPFEKLLERIPLPPDIMNALCFREGPLSSWLGLAEALERGDLRQASGLLARIGCSRLETVSAKYQEAHEFAQY